MLKHFNSLTSFYVVTIVIIKNKCIMTRLELKLFIINLMFPYRIGYSFFIRNIIFVMVNRKWNFAKQANPILFLAPINAELEFKFFSIIKPNIKVKIC